MQTNDVKTKRVHNLIIVDESGSMEVIRKQAFVGMNEKKKYSPFKMLRLCKRTKLRLREFTT